MTFAEPTHSRTASNGEHLEITEAETPHAINVVWLRHQIERGKTYRFSATHPLTQAMARDILVNHNRSNRGLSLVRAAKYARIITDGRWLLTSQGMSFTKDGSLIDGQHRAQAVILAKKTIPMTFWFGCEPQEFTVLDNGGSRTAADILTIAKKAHPKTLAAFARLLAIVGKKEALDPNAIAVFAAALDQDRAQEACTIGTRGIAIAAPSTIALAHYWIATITRHNAHMQAVFWDRLISGADLQRGQLLSFREQLLKSKNNKTRTTSDLQIVTAGEAVAHWNSFVSGKKRVDMEGVSGYTLPKVI